jgi:hypothetical protein
MNTVADAGWSSRQVRVEGLVWPDRVAGDYHDGLAVSAAVSSFW